MHNIKINAVFFTVKTILRLLNQFFSIFSTRETQMTDVGTNPNNIFVGILFHRNNRTIIAINVNNNKQPKNKTRGNLLTFHHNI